MAEVTLDFPAPPDSLFTEEAARGMVGQDVPLKLGDTVHGRGHVLGATVTGHGRSLALRLRVADELARFMGAIESAHAFSFVEPSIAGPRIPTADELPTPGDFA